MGNDASPDRAKESLQIHLLPQTYALLAIYMKRGLTSDAETRNTYHRPDPAFSYLFTFFLILTSLAWGLAYSPSFSSIAKLTLVFVFVHFLFGSLVLSTLAYFLIGRLLGPGVAGLPGRRRQQGLFGPPSGGNRGDVLEFGYCFDVTIRAFFPVYTLLYILQFMLMPLIARTNPVSTFTGNLLYLAAATYWTVTIFLGYNAIHFLHHTQLLLMPMAGWLTIWLVCTILNINLPNYGVKWMFLGIALKKGA